MSENTIVTVCGKCQSPRMHCVRDGQERLLGTACDDCKAIYDKHGRYLHVQKDPIDGYGCNT